MPTAIKLVFSNYKYIVLAVVIFVGLLIPLLIISEYIFLEPYVVSHLPSGTELGFVLIVIVSASGGVFGSIIGAAAGACSCGPIGFAVISTFGAAGGVATSFLTNYEIPIRLLAIAILIFTYYTTAKSLKVECKISG
jgi:hypothetical protein